MSDIDSEDDISGDGGYWPQSHHVIDFWFSEDFCSLAVMFNSKRFYIDILADDIQKESTSPESNSGTGNLRKEFLRLLHGMNNDADLQEDLQDWAIDPVIPYFDDLAPLSELLSTLTLEVYYSSVIYVFKLVGIDGVLQAVGCPEDYRVNEKYPDAILLSELPNHQSPSIDATEIKIVPQPSFEDLIMANIPRKVLVNEKVYYFKQTQDRDSFEREFGILVEL